MNVTRQNKRHRQDLWLARERVSSKAAACGLVFAFLVGFAVLWVVGR